MRRLFAVAVVFALIAGSADAGPLQEAAHTAAWDKAMDQVKCLRVDLELTRTDAVFEKERRYTGSLLFLKPHYGILRINNAGDTTKTDYEAFIYDGETLYQYNGIEKTVTEWKVPAAMLFAEPRKDAPPSQLLQSRISRAIFKCGIMTSGINPNALRDKFDIRVFKQDESHLYLELNARRKTDWPEKEIRMALYGPNVKDSAFLPVQLFIREPNGDTELWRFSKHIINPPGVDEKAFEYKEMDGFKLRKVPAAKDPE